MKREKFPVYQYLAQCVSSADEAGEKGECWEWECNCVYVTMEQTVIPQTCKGTLRQVFNMSEAPPLPLTHTLTHCKRVCKYTYSHREGEGELTRVKVRGAI